MPLLNHTNVRAQEASDSSVVGTVNNFIGNTTDGIATYLTGTERAIEVDGPRFLYKFCTADTQVKDGPGLLHALAFHPNDAAATAGTIIVYDSDTEAGAVIYRLDIQAAAFVPLNVILDVEFTAGLYVGFTTTADVNLTVSYR